MKLQIVSVNYAHGTSYKKDPKGRPYEIYSVQALSPFETISTDNYTLEGAGYAVNDISCTKEAYEHIKKLKFPAAYDFTTDVIQQFGRMETVITGLNGDYAKASNG